MRRLSTLVFLMTLPALLASCPDKSATPGAAGATGAPGAPGAPGGTGAPGATNAIAAGDGLVITNADNPRPTYHDFGRRLFGEQLKHVFQLRNDDPVPVTIEDMLPACSCTVPRAWYVAADGTRVDGSIARGQTVITVPPRAVLQVECQLDTTHVEHMNADKLTSVRVRCDSAATPYITLEMHLFVTRAFRAVPPSLDLGEVPVSVGKGARTDVTVSLNGDPSRIDKIESTTGPFEATLQASEVLGETVWIVTATAAPGLPLGPLRGEVVLATLDGAGKKSQSFVVPILGTVVTDIVVHPPVLQLGALERGKGTRIEAELVSLVPGTRMRVTQTRIDGAASAHLKLETKAAGADAEGRAARWTIALVADAELADPVFQGTIYLQTDDPTTPIVTVRYSGTTR